MSCLAVFSVTDQCCIEMMEPIEYVLAERFFLIILRRVGKNMDISKIESTFLWNFVPKSRLTEKFCQSMPSIAIYVVLD